MRRNEKGDSGENRVAGVVFMAVDALLLLPRFSWFPDLSEGWPFFVQFVLTRNADLAELEGAAHLQIAQSFQQVMVDLGLQLFGVAAKYADLLGIKDDAVRHIVQDGNDIPERIVDPRQSHVSVALFIVGKLGDSQFCTSFAGLVRGAFVVTHERVS